MNGGGGGERGFNNQTGPILVHIYPLIYILIYMSNMLSNMTRTFWVKRKILFFGGHVGSLHQIQGYIFFKLGLSCFPAILSPISMYIWNKEAIWKELFKFKSKILKTIIFFIFGGFWGTHTKCLRTRCNDDYRGYNNHDHIILTPTPQVQMMT